LDFWLTHTTQNISTCSAVELGIRNGGLSLWLASQGARVLSSDVDLPTRTAIQLHKAHGVSHLIQYESIDATNIPYTMEFDVVLFKSMLGAVGRQGGKQLQTRAVNEIHRALKKGGELFFAENLIGSRVHQFFRKISSDGGRLGVTFLWKRCKNSSRLFRTYSILPGALWARSAAVSYSATF
jgi:SAM-dependent methyltransferase